MITTLEKIQKQRFLLSSIIIIAAINVISNFYGEEVAVLVGNFSYIPVTIGLLLVSFLVLKRFGISGQHGLAWIGLVGFSISWFFAEMTWITEEVFLNVKPFPSIADVFYLLGYPFLFMFLIYYLVPFKSAINKKMTISAILIAIAILIPSLYCSLTKTEPDGFFEFMLALLYPISDAIMIIPALIGIALFFKGEVNFMWTLVCLGILSVFIADAAFFLAQFDDTYYTGSPMEILFLWTYIFLSFGVYNQFSVFQKRITNNNKSDFVE